MHKLWSQHFYLQSKMYFVMWHDILFANLSTAVSWLDF